MSSNSLPPIVPLTWALSLGLALLVNRLRFMRAFFRSVFFLPTACSYVAAALIWKMSIFNGVRFGLANTVIGWFGVENNLSDYVGRPREASPFPLQIETVRLIRVFDYQISNKDLIVLGSAAVMMVVLDQFVLSWMSSLW